MVINISQRSTNSKLYEEKIKKFWSEICVRKQENNPAWDNDGTKDEQFNDEINDDELFFLSFRRHGTSDRTCNVDEGKRIFIVPSGVEVSEFEVPNASVDELRDLALKDQNLALLSGGPVLVMDGIPIVNVNHYNVYQGTVTFEVKFPSSDAIFPGKNDLSDKPVKAVAAGRYVISEPLSRGQHNVFFSSTIQCPPGEKCVEEYFHEEVSYELIVG